MQSRNPDSNASKIFQKKYNALDKKGKRAFDIYKKTSSIIERTDVALGRKALYKNSTASTVETSVGADLNSNTHEI
jgi:hypothetical protein